MPDQLIAPQRGDVISGVWAPINVGVPPQLLNMKNDSVDLSCLLYDITNTGSFGVKSRLAGTADYSGTINATFDLANPPYLPPLYILPGMQGIYGKGVSVSGKVIQLPVVLEKVHYQSGVESEVQYSADVKGSARAGTLIYPAGGP